MLKKQEKQRDREIAWSLYLRNPEVSIKDLVPEWTELTGKKSRLLYLYVREYKMLWYYRKSIVSKD
jgi:hypothetical protein